MESWEPAAVSPARTHEISLRKRIPAPGILRSDLGAEAGDEPEEDGKQGKAEQADAAETDLKVAFQGRPARAGGRRAVSISSAATGATVRPPLPASRRRKT